MTPIESDDAQAVLREWFGELGQDGSVDAAHKARWWKKDPGFDAHLAKHFADALTRAKQGVLDGWTQTPRGALALVILLDQFGRNIYRGTPQMYAGDFKALTIAKQAIARRYDELLTPVERSFLYMPFMHSEDLSEQERCVELFTELGMNIDYAIQHRDIVARFGRFPHRNPILGRASTPEETEFLKQPGSSF